MPSQALVALATVIAAGFTLIGVLATQRAARSIAATTAQAAIKSSREQAEEESYARARATLEAIIDRQDAEIEDLNREVTGLRHEQRDDRAELRRLRAKVDEQTGELANTKRELSETRGDLAATRQVLTRTEENLAAAEELLRRHYPDEPGDGHADPDRTPGGTP